MTDPAYPPSKTYLHSCSDAELHSWIVESRAGWQDAFEVLFMDRYAGTVISALRSVEQHTGAVLSTTGVFNELFLHLYGRTQAWHNLRSWDSSRSLSAWLWVVARHIACKMAKKASLQARSHGFEELESLECSRELRLSHGPLQEDALAIEDLFDQIGGRCAQILRLKYYLKMKDDEIGALLDISREWANKVCRKCVKELSVVFQREGLEPADLMSSNRPSETLIR